MEKLYISIQFLQESGGIVGIGEGVYRVLLESEIIWCKKFKNIEKKYMQHNVLSFYNYIV